jgi:hypothetical protein
LARGWFRSLLATVCIGSAVATSLVVGTTAKGATPSPLVYAVNPFGNEPGYPGLVPFQLSTGAIAESKVITVTTGPFAGEPVAGANALAQDPTDSKYYTAIKFGEEFEQGNPRHLATIDVATGIATTIGQLSNQIAGLAFRTDGTLYAVSGDNFENPSACDACLYEVNKLTAALTFRKDLGTGRDANCCGESIGYNPLDDMIYHSSHHSPDALFEKIDPDNAFAQTPVGFSGSGDGPDEVTGIGWDGTNFVMTDSGPDVWSVTPSGAFTLVSTPNDDLFYRGLVVGDPVTVLDFGDAPSPYPTLAADDGASHVPTGPALGGRADAEPDGLPSVDADGDDTDGLDDEDAVTFKNDLLAGEVTELEIEADVPDNDDGILDAWIDYNRDGDWDDLGEQVFNSVDLDDGETEISILVPSNASQGVSYARFRISSGGDLDPTGEAPDGEVEDYKVLLKQRLPNQKFRCGQEVKGTVKLNTDLLDCPEHGLVVIGRDTTVNLNGHVIDGSNVGVGVFANLDKPNTVVKGAGGTIKEFGTGVSISCSEDALIKGVFIQDMTSNGIFVCGKGAVVTGNEIDGTRDGIGFQDNRITVTENTISNVSRDGIHGNCCGNKKSLVAENTISNSGEDGIDLDLENVTVKNNDIFVSAEDGLNVNDGVDVDTIKGGGNDTNGSPCLPARLCAP